MISIWKALADENRRTILFLLQKKDMNPNELLKYFDFSPPALSSHLGILKEAGLIKERRDGTYRKYSINSKGISNAERSIGELLHTGIDNLKNSVEKK